MTQLTPMMQQYMQLKEQHPDTVLFFQLGDFYETFFEDAKIAARELDIVLTQRDEMPMAGVPIKKADVYINRLLKRGIKVVVCDQVGDPKKAKGIVKREVKRVITPGTVLDEEVLERATNNYLVAVFDKYKSWALAVCDVSTGAFRSTSFSKQPELLDELAKLAPAELLFPEGVSIELPPELERVPKTFVSSNTFTPEALTSHFRMASLNGLGLSELETQVAGGLYNYLKRTQQTLSHLQRPQPYVTRDTLKLDPFTARNLELVRELRDGGTQTTLLGVLNRAITGMGQRLLRQWLLNPLLDVVQIEKRLDAVEVLVGQGLQRTLLRDTLKSVYDIERLVGRLGTGRISPRDLLSLKQSLAQLPDVWLQVKSIHDQHPVAIFAELANALESLSLRQLSELLERAIRQDAPHLIKDGGVIKASFHPELQTLVQAENLARQQLLDLETQQRKATGIGSLKVGYNTVFGYYIEVTKTHAQKVPPHYHRKQTLSNAERYIIPELKALEEKILAAQERARELEYRLFCEVRDAVAQHTRDLQALAQALAQLDVLVALAEVAQRHDYVRPAFNDGACIDIQGGRHPVVEQLSPQPFVPNPLKLDSTETLVVLTGPNMSGKSTYLRQVALIALMAQMGSFVPAETATLPLFDQIFTRVGASDMLAGGYSTFMVEMLETANILNNASDRSLVLLDEMGRGTSTFDGVSIAWAVAEYLVRHVKAKTLFATHYHELTQLAGQLKQGVVNMHVRVKEYGDDVIFLHRVGPGSAQGSYGVHVAKLAGLPEAVVREAQVLLDRILSANPLERIDGAKTSKGPKVIQQLALFRSEDHPVIQALSELDVNSLTPIQALEWLARLKEQL